jgi:signal transduction histidine kinase
MKKGFTVFFISIWIASMAFGQSIQIIDDLNIKAETHLNNNLDTAIVLAKKAIELSKEKGYSIGISQGLGILGFSCYVKGDYENAKSYCEESIAIGQENSIEKELSLAFHALGLISINQGNNDEAIRIFTQLVDVATKASNQHLIADACNNLGLAYLNKKYYQRAQQWLILALNLYNEIEHPQGEVFANLNYGRLFFEQNEYDSAFFYLQKSAQIAELIDNDRARLHTESMLGQIRLREDRLTEAERYFLQAYEISSNLDLLWEKANLSAWLCELYYYKKNYTEAIRYGEIAIALGKEAKIIHVLQKVNNLLAKSYLESNEFQKAERHVNYLEHLIDSLALEDSVDLISAIIDVNALKEEEQNLELVSNQLAKAKADISRRNILLIGSILASILLLIILILIVRSNRAKTKNNDELRNLNAKINKQKERLEKANDDLDSTNKEKDLLLGMVAHDMRSPLNKISGLMRILQLENGVDANQHEVYGMVQRTIKDANKLADELLEINKIESGAIKKAEDTLVISEFIMQLVEQHKAIADEKNIQLKFIQNCADIEFVSDRKMLQRIFENLVSNAIKFSEKNSVVIVKADVDNSQIKLQVIDNGLGIPEEEHQHLFTKFGKTSTRPTNGESSNGLGLYIVDQLIKTLGGNLTFQSKVGVGSQFAVLLPIAA